MAGCKAVQGAHFCEGAAGVREISGCTGIFALGRADNRPLMEREGRAHSPREMPVRQPQECYADFPRCACDLGGGDGTKYLPKPRGGVPTLERPRLSVCGRRGGSRDVEAKSE